LTGTYLNPRSKHVVRADRVHKHQSITLSSGDVFGVPVKNNHDQFYEICRFLVEELLDGETRHVAVPKNSKILDDQAVSKIRDLERKKIRNRQEISEFERIKRTSNTESRKRIRPCSPVPLRNTSDEDDPNIDDLCSEIKFLRDANERFPLKFGSDPTFLQRAQNEVHLARKQLSDWAFQADVPSEIAANIQILVGIYSCWNAVFLSSNFEWQEQEKRAKEAELILNFKEGSSTRLGNIKCDHILNGVSPQISVRAPEMSFNIVHGAPETATTNQCELHVARESLTTTRKRCDDLDRALNQV
jgi:hypothetical protein